MLAIQNVVNMIFIQITIYGIIMVIALPLLLFLFLYLVRPIRSSLDQFL